MHFEMHGDRFDSKLSYNVRGRALPRKKHEFRCSSTPKPSTPQSWLASRHRWANSGKPRPRGDMCMGRRSEVRKVDVANFIRYERAVTIPRQVAQGREPNSTSTWGKQCALNSLLTRESGFFKNLQP